MTISFKYKTIKRPDETLSKTPSIPITLIGKDMQFDSIALLDSGADISAMPKDMADLLGLNLENPPQPAYGIGGKVDATESNFTFIIEKDHEKYQFTIPVKIILGDYDFPILIGRAGFFDKFIITFDESKEKVSLKKIQENS